MRADTNKTTLTIGRGVGQSVYIGRSLEQKDLVNSCDIRVTLMGLYRVKRSTVARLSIAESVGAEMEVMLAEKHKLPVVIQDVEIYYTGVREYAIEETQCMRCGAEQEPKPQKRLNGLITLRAPKDARISRGNRIGKRVR
jgi:hypothetical protein